MRGFRYRGAGVLAAAAVSALAGLAQAGTVNAYDNANAMVDSLLGSGASRVGNATFVGATDAAGYFDSFGSAIGVNSGIILTSGRATNAIGPNNNDSEGWPNSEPGDGDLDALVPGYSTRDACILEFDFTVASGDLYFNYVFASEEYNEWVGSSFNDVFGFFLDGVNIALIPSTTTPVSINNVNNGSNSPYYYDNTGATRDTQYDGFTTVLTAQKLGIGTGTHHIKLAIADAGDWVLDSAVFIQAGTFDDDPHPVVPLPASAWMGLSTLGLLGAIRLGRRKS